MTSMLEYLASLRQYGHRPVRLGEIRIGRTHYAAGEFVNAHDEHTRIALMPMYRSDHVTRDSAGPTPALLPASYRRSSNTVYNLDGALWYISGWHTGRTNKTHAENHDGVFWLDRVVLRGNDFRFRSPNVQTASIVHWTESFDAAMALAGPEVRARIAGLSA